MVFSCFAHLAPPRSYTMSRNRFRLDVDKLRIFIGFVPQCSYLTFCHLLIHDRYELMSECWNEDPSSRPSFSELIDRLEMIMARDVPYCDLNKHDESHPYYNVPANTDEHSG